MFRFAAIGLILLIAGCGPDLPPEIAKFNKQLPEKVDFNYHIKPILSDRCFACHGPDKNKIEAGLRFDLEEIAVSKLESGNHAIVPGNLKRSEMYHRIVSQNKDDVMPPPESNLVLSDYEKALLTRWIEQGAEYKPHWSFIPPEKPEIPDVAQKERVENPIDQFVVAKLQKDSLRLSPEASKETLIRRLSFDLTGLPPTVDEIDDFLADKSPNAYEKVVDKLLASPRYGERMATEWLDVARYADTYGYTVDRYRPTWQWRDWVIKAFNQNMPYNQFVTWQLAGDMLPNATKEQVLATGFNRNHAQNAEGGIVNEEFRVEYVADRTNTLGRAFLGLTVECARCHDHKYDPISQKEYYQLFGFFNQVDESGQITYSKNDMPAPTMLLPDEKVEEKIAYLNKKIAQQEKDLETLKETEQKSFQSWISREKLQMVNANSGLIAHYNLEAVSKSNIPNAINIRQPGKYTDPISENLAEDDPVITKGYEGNGIKLNGDDALYFPEVGQFKRSDPFSIGLWLKVPESLENGVIFHSNRGAIIFNFKGYQVSIEENKLDVRLAHAFPYNAIHLVSETAIPKEKWQQLTLTYDGSSRAAGVHLFLDGEPVAMKTLRDHLYKEIVFVKDQIPTHLKVGARWRSRGLKDGEVDEIKVFDRELTALEVNQLAGGQTLVQLLQKPKNALTQTDLAQLKTLYLNQFDQQYQQNLKALAASRQAENALMEQAPEVMVMDEMDQPRPTFLLERGNYSDHGEALQPGTPAHLLKFAENLPKNRLGLAEWLFDPENPLTARVIVNRYWQQYFGRGIVATPEDFGNQGELPSHPELLDWLAIEFQESGWDIKKLQKLIVMSATYRQSSQVSEALLEKDPDNVLLARGSKMRLTAEMMRDNALAVSGLLVSKIGGPSVKPYQPEGLWKVNGDEYVQDSGEKLYRRSMYTFWKRTVPPPTMNTFDAPDRSYCVVKRQKTSTPLQALALMNDPQFVEASRMIAERIMQEKSNPEDQVMYAFRLLTSRFPTEEETQVLQNFYQDELENFKTHPAKVEGMLKEGEFAVNKTLDQASLAAHTVVINTLMNHDACVIKR